MRTIHPHETEVRVFEVDAIRQVVHQRLEQGPFGHQRFLCPLARRDITEHYLRSRLALERDGTCGHLDIERSPIGLQVFLFDESGQHFPPVNVLYPLGDPFALIGMDEIQHRPAEQLLHGFHPERPYRFGIGEHQTACAVHHNRDRSHLDQTAIALFTLAQRCLSLQLFFDIDETLQQDLPALQRDVRHRLQDRKRGPIRPQQYTLGRADIPAQADDGTTVRRSGTDVVVAAHTHNLFAHPAEQRECGGVDIDDRVRFCVDDHHSDRHGFENGLDVRFAFLQCALRLDLCSDVARGDQYTDDLATLVTQRGAYGLVPARTGWGLDTVLAPDWPSSRDDFQVFVAETLRKLLGNQLEIGLADNFGLRLVEKLADGVIAQHNARVEVLEEDRISQSRQNRLEKAALLADFHLEPFAFGDVTLG